MTYIQFTRRKDDERIPKSINVHESYISDFIFKSVDLESELKITQKHSGLLLKAITDILKPTDVKKVLNRHFELMIEQ